MKTLLPFFIVYLLFSASCQNPSPAPPNDPPVLPSNDSITIPLQIPAISSNTLLIFKKEKKIELWENQKLVETFDCASANFERTPIGTFSVSDKNQDLINFEFPNDFYAQKKQSLTSLRNNDARLRLNEVCYKNRINSLLKAEQIWVFPNDARTSSQFDPCIGCPHWTAELYSRLFLLLRQFK